MKSYQQRQSRKLYEDAKILREKHGGRLGNELKDTKTGGTILPSPFKEKSDSFKKKIAEHPDKNKKALGELGMEKVAKSTFKSDDKLKAGRTPTLSRGMPVQEAMMSGGEMRDDAEAQIDTFKQTASPITQRFLAYAENKPMQQLQQAQQELQTLLPLLIQKSNPMRAKQAVRGSVQDTRQAYQQFGREQEPEAAQVGQPGTASMAACKKV